MIFGAHISVADGLVRSLEYARSVGCECAQIFAKSPRQWRAKPLDAALAAEFVKQREAAGFGPVFTHTAYLINLSTPNPELWEKSIVALADELERGALLGAAGVVTHVGNDPDGDLDAAAKRVGLAIRRARELAGEGAGCARLLLENTAGAGTSYGSTFEELALAIEASGEGSETVGVCLDTCHAFAYGEALDTEQGWRQLVDRLESCLGVDRLGLVHANDCKFERGSRKDRHAWIGDGFIAEAGFKAMVCVPELARVPAVTEMPGEVPDKDAINLTRLKGLRDACA